MGFGRKRSGNFGWLIHQQNNLNFWCSTMTACGLSKAVVHSFLAFFFFRALTVAATYRFLWNIT